MVTNRTHIEQPSPTGLKILVVDDNVDAAKMFALLFKLDGHDVRTAFSGAETIKTIEDFTPDAVFLDIGLPIMNGYQIAERLRQMAALENTMLVAMTGFSSHEDRERAKQAGFDHHVVKPADPSVIQDLLTKAAGRRWIGRESLA